MPRGTGAAALRPREPPERGQGAGPRVLVTGGLRGRSSRAGAFLLHFHRFQWLERGDGAGHAAQPGWHPRGEPRASSLR